MFWLPENHSRLNKPGMSVVEVTKTVDTEWNKVEDKEKHEKMAAQDKQRYEANPNAPKRGKSAYMFWQVEIRSRLTKPGMSVVGVTKAAGAEWNKLKMEAKYAMSTQDKQRYEAETKKYKAAGDGGSSKKSSLKNKKIGQLDPNVPKRGKSAYMFWLAMNRSRLTKPGMSVVDVTKTAGAEWNKVKEKGKYEKMAAQDKQRYDAEMKKHKTDGGGGSSKKSSLKKK